MHFMSMFREKYCIANWKMNFTQSHIRSFISKWKSKKVAESHVKTIFCPSFTDINITAELLRDSRTEIGAQNVCYKSNGAFTGEVSCPMLKEVECKWVIIGHSERRSIFNETDKIIQEKLKIILTEDLHPILCIGESKEERDAGRTLVVLAKQLSILSELYEDILSNIVIAYEPVWAIGTGDAATSDMISNAHNNIRNILDNNGLNGGESSILYGGSVNDNNASEISNIDDVDGFLIGGASLDVDKFYTIFNQL